MIQIFGTRLRKEILFLVINVYLDCAFPHVVRCHLLNINALVKSLFHLFRFFGEECSNGDIHFFPASNFTDALPPLDVD
jgi:hypothetical protein